MNKNDGKSGHLKYVIFIFIITFFIASVMYLFSQIVLENIESIIIGFVLLMVVILIGIMFDVVGTAIAVANPSTFRAKASCKLPGAKKSLHLINNADKVANICNDVIGDICGTVSGGIGAALVYIVVSTGEKGIMIASVIMTGIIASLTVGGKALGKNFAINNADFIIWNVGKILDIKAILLNKKESRI
jgi:Mg2+/Co2+ transporter CorB